MGLPSCCLCLFVTQIRTCFLHFKFAGDTAFFPLACDIKGSCLGQLVSVLGLMTGLDKKDPCVFLTSSTPSHLQSPSGSLSFSISSTVKFPPPQSHSLSRRGNRAENMGRSDGCLAFLTGSLMGRTLAVFAVHPVFHNAGCSYSQVALLIACVRQTQ